MSDPARLLITSQSETADLTLGRLCRRVEGGVESLADEVLWRMGFMRVEELDFWSVPLRPARPSVRRFLSFRSTHLPRRRPRRLSRRFPSRSKAGVG